MPTYTARKELLAPLEDVWLFLAEPHHLSDWWPGVAGVSIPGDCDGDGDADLDDYADLEACLAGPGGGLGPDCGCFDLDGDEDIDVVDFAEFQTVFTGPL